MLTFAAIDISSYDVSLEIFEIGKKPGIRSVDRIRRRLEIGRETYTNGKVSNTMVDELCRILIDFRSIAESYRVDHTEVIATSAIREAENDLFILGRIRRAAGYEVRVLSNSEQRFLNYKAIAANEDRFRDMIESGTAIVDLDGGSMQISLFDKAALITTQNMRIGNLRIRERLQQVSANAVDYETLVRQLIYYDIFSFKKMYLKDRKIKNLILSGDFITDVIFKNTKNRTSHLMSREEFDEWYRKGVGKPVYELAISNDMPMETASLLRPSAVIYHHICEEFDPQTIWIPGSHLSRGLAYEFAENRSLLRQSHDFENDIITAARHMAKRYAIGRPHLDNMDMTATALYDALRKSQRYTPRDRLLLRVTVMLHDVGKYISYNFIGECTFNIIMSNEIIGLSHAEREIIALTAKHMTVPLPSFDDVVVESSLNEDTYLKMSQMCAIMRYVNALDRSHMQKIQSIRAVQKDQELHIHLIVNQEYILENGLLDEETEFFYEVFGLRPVLHIKRKM